MDSQQGYYDSILGPPPDSEHINDIPGKWVGVDRPRIEHGTANFHWSELPKVKGWPHPPRDFGDNDPSDPEQNWDTDSFKE